MRLVLLLDNFDRVFESQLISADAMDELRPLTFEMALLVATEQPLHDLDQPFRRVRPPLPQRVFQHSEIVLEFALRNRLSYRQKSG